MLDLNPIPKWDFYKAVETPDHVLTIQTGDQQRFANLLSRWAWHGLPLDTIPVIDSHQHFWQLSQPLNYSWLDAPPLLAIKRNFLPEHLEPHLRVAGVSHTIVVQTQHDLRENLWLLDLADKHPFIAGVVGWVNLASPACEEQLQELRRHPKFVGVRHLTQDEADDLYLVRDDVLRACRCWSEHGVPFDLLLHVKHLGHAATLARRFPSLPLVIDHLAKPFVKDHKTEMC